MPPKSDEVAIVMVRTVGGEPPAMSSLAPKLGPLGMSPKKVGDDVQKATKGWKGLKVTCKLMIQNRQCEVEVIPSAASLIIQALKEPPRNRKVEKNIVHNGNITLNDVLGIARTMRERSMAKEFSGTVKEILGTCQSIGCTVDGQPPHDLIDQINEGSLPIPEK
eukprot:CAMPEP_0168582318 /NCGR_PEP_ID=MMETSP0420-20121227/1914_1 /TAXON_ID=498008 /ORGANISM="Pessonella sp." /LENGTH=163 /DNA_ID=CAMNT_0008616789 /DNA_START=162 /DNA_END=653 /DNA_ORIENTATION=-